MTEQFKDWVAGQDAEECFAGNQPTECAVFRFLKERGYPVDFVGILYWYDCDGRLHGLPDALSRAASWATRHTVMNRYTTFGALATRLAAL